MSGTEKRNGKLNGAGNGSGESENGKKLPPERNKRGQFVNSPGPGRPGKELPKPLDLDEFKTIITEGMRSKDGKERAVWARVMLAYNKQVGVSKDDPIMDQFVDEIMSLSSDLANSYSNKTGIPTSPIEMIGEMAKVCRSCDRFGGEENWFEEVEGGDDDE